MYDSLIAFAGLDWSGGVRYPAASAECAVPR
jgi:hypothetical protein